MASILFKRALGRLTAPNRRNITNTAVRRSDDPLLGHIEQGGMSGQVIH